MSKDWQRGSGYVDAPKITKELGVGKATLSYWMLKLDIEYRKVALAPGESIEIRRLSG